MHLAPLIQDLAIILAVAAVVTLIFQKIRQPVVLGYIIAGLIIGPHTPPFPFVSDLPSIRVWADLGVIFLMFYLGLEFSFRKLTNIGISSSLTGFIEITFMLFIGYFTGQALDWSRTDSLFLGAMLSISSTTIIIKALEELKLKTRRFAQMIFGILIVEDLVAILILVALSTVAATEDFSGLEVVKAGGQLVLVIGSWFMIGYFLVPRFVKYVGRIGNNEMLTVLSIGLCLSLASIAGAFGYSAALGAFIMGSILAESTESHRIQDLLLPLRDLFAAIFFVSVGMLMDPTVLMSDFWVILLLAAILILGKAFSVTFGSLVSGQTLRTSVQVGMGLTQIGEFSFIIAGLGLSLGVMSEKLFAIAVAVSLITTFTTPYMIRFSHEFSVKLEASLPLLVKQMLSRYAAWSQERRADAARRAIFYRLLFIWVLNGLLVTVIFTVVANMTLPSLVRLLPSRGSAGLAAWTISVLLSAPFIWAMFSVFKKLKLGETEKPEQLRGGTLLVVRFLTVIWIGILSNEFFAARHALLLTAGLAILLFVAFYRQLEASYHWIEKNFASTFEDSNKTQNTFDVLSGLAPWDAHLVRLKIHPNADIAGKTLIESELRSRYGLNVIAIQRGLKTLVAPAPHERLFPKDEILVLATDEQIDAARPRIEKPPGLAERFKNIEGYQLSNILLSEGSPLIGETIRSSGLREKYGLMVVGVEREGHRMINPDSDMKLIEADILWLVGDAANVSSLEHEIVAESPDDSKEQNQSDL